MKKIIILCVLIPLIPLFSIAQGIRGTVIDQDGMPLPFTTIYVKQTGSGSISNEIGKYELRLEPGRYNINFQYLGYKSQQIEVEVGTEFQIGDIILEKQAYLLNAAEVDGGSEDPAYRIMRKAIAKSSYHRQQVDHYTCEVYLKGGGRLKKAPWFMKKILEEEGIDTSATFISESVSEITYNRPGEYTEKVISIRTSGDDRNSNPMNYISSSLYEPTVAGIISPFSPKAFAYYKFRYISTFTDRGYQVNEIKVIPRSIGEDVFTGTIYIVENLWSIHSAELAVQVQGVDIDISQVYAPIKEAVWMPVSHRYDGEGKILGFAFEFQYLATVRDYNITLNPDLSNDFDIVDPKTEEVSVDTVAAPKKVTINEAMSDAEKKLMSGEELTPKELRKLMRDYERKSMKDQEEPTVVETRKINIDSLAYKSDSAYWADVRPVPLNERERKGYALQDSLSAEAKKKTEGDTLNTGKGKFSVTDVLFGNTYDLKKGNYLTLKSPLPTIRFNAVDGWNGEYQVQYIKRFKKDKRLEISPTYRYAFARNQSFGKIASEYRYGSGLKKGRVSLTGGYYYSQFNPQEPITSFTNSISALVGENHYMKIYDRNFIEAEWLHKIAHNVYLSPYLGFSEREETFINTNQVWFPNENKSYGSNLPENRELENTTFGRSKALKARINFSLRPGARYTKRGDNYYRANNPPTLNLTYEKAIPDVFGTSADYDLVSLEVKYDFNLNLLGKISLRSEAGKFIRSETMDFMDYAHFMGNQTIFTRYAQMSGYSIAPYYLFSTNDQYISTYVNYEFRQLLFTHIRALRLTGVKENLNINHLITPSVNHYLELSYSVDNIFRFFRIDVTGSFVDGQYYDFRVQLGITSDLISF